MSSDPKQFQAIRREGGQAAALARGRDQRQRKSESPPQGLPPRAEAEFSEQHSRDLALRKTGISVMNATNTAAILSTIHAVPTDGMQSITRTSRAAAAYGPRLVDAKILAVVLVTY